MHVPMSEPPKKPTNWWRTVPGQTAILVVCAGVLLILCQLLGIVHMLPSQH